MASGGNLYPNWLGSASLSIPTNTINTTVTVPGIGSYATTVNVVPQILLSSISTALLDTNNPSEILALTVSAPGWYKTDYNGFAYHVSASNWTAMSQLIWNVKRNNTTLSNTQTLIEPQYNSGASVSEFITMPGSGVFSANAGDLIEWTTDADATGGGSINTGFYSGFGYITLQKIG